MKRGCHPPAVAINQDSQAEIKLWFRSLTCDSRSHYSYSSHICMTQQAAIQINCGYPSPGTNRPSSHGHSWLIGTAAVCQNISGGILNNNRKVTRRLSHSLFSLPLPLLIFKIKYMTGLVHTFGTRARRLIDGM